VGKWPKYRRKKSDLIEVGQKGCHCAERVCHLPLTCDTGTAKRFLYVSIIYLSTTQTLWKREKHSQSYLCINMNDKSALT